MALLEHQYSQARYYGGKYTFTGFSSVVSGTIQAANHDISLVYNDIAADPNDPNLALPGSYKLYVNGTEYLSASDSTNYTDTYFLIGGWYSTSYLMDGYIDEFRISLKARYTSNFTAPTKAFPNL